MALLFLWFPLSGLAQSASEATSRIKAARKPKLDLELKSEFQEDSKTPFKTGAELQGLFPINRFEQLSLLLGTEAEFKSTEQKIEATEVMAGFQYRTKFYDQKLRATVLYSQLVSEQNRNDKSRSGFSEVELELRPTLFHVLDTRFRLRHQAYNRISNKKKVERDSFRIQTRPLYLVGSFAAGFEHQITRTSLRDQFLFNQELAPTLKYETKSFEFVVQASYLITDKQSQLIAQEVSWQKPTWAFEIETSWD